MFYVLNIFILLLILLIAYWWANQGVFSAILHLVAVIIAGAVALGFWELITINLLLRGTWFDEYAWGVSLVVVFVITLFVVRLAFDKLAPGNVDLPHWANLTFGLVIGLVAAELTMGIFLIGAGHIQTQRTIMGVNGWQRGSNGQVQKDEDLPFWTMAPEVTSEFFSRLSVGALSTSTPLRHYNPELYKQTTLIRDGVTNANNKLVAKVSTVPDGVRIDQVFRCLELNQYAVAVTFDKKTFDGGGGQLAISAAQVRLIGQAGGSAPAPVAHPVEWCQATATVANKYKFDSESHFATSVPGKENAQILFRFRISDLGQTAPRFLQIRGTRFVLPSLGTTSDVDAGELEAKCFLTGVQASPAEFVACDNVPALQREEIEVSARLPVVLGANRLPGGITLQDVDGRKKLFESRNAELTRAQDRPARSLQVDEFYERPGTRIVKLDVSRHTTADIFGSAARDAGDDATPLLIDSNGSPYSPIGYIHDRERVFQILLDRVERVGSKSRLPTLSSSGTEKLWLIFEVTEGVDLTCFRLSNVPIAAVNVTVPGAAKSAPPAESDPTSAEIGG